MVCSREGNNSSWQLSARWLHFLMRFISTNMETISDVSVTNFPSDYPWYRRWGSNITYFCSQIPFVPRKNLLTRRDIRSMQKYIAPWDILLVGNFQHASALFIEGIATHAIAYMGKGRCIHAFAHGVSYIPLRKVLRTYDTAILIRPYNFSGQDRYFAFLREKIGKPYDFYFWVEDTEEEKFFCTRLINDALLFAGYPTGLQSIAESRNPIDKILDPTFRAQRALRPDKFLDGHFSVVYHSQNIVYKDGKYLLRQGKLRAMFSF